ncbi:hypothetical protein [Mesorhizobium sp. NFR06]|uniref:hypothetical protein n=1 Tax=Mesorhizobium sp. NFR06 TaxID=1566290 RepID=UPI00122D764B|nr:hypothetical protein [Mesorhizobium sp. NFR06]
MRRQAAVSQRFFRPDEINGQAIDFTQFRNGKPLGTFPGIANIFTQFRNGKPVGTFPGIAIISRNSGTENRWALFLELLWTGRIAVL